MVSKLKDLFSDAEASGTGTATPELSPADARRLDQDLARYDL